jgi:hypothetical protein
LNLFNEYSKKLNHIEKKEFNTFVDELLVKDTRVLGTYKFDQNQKYQGLMEQLII